MPATPENPRPTKLMKRWEEPGDVRFLTFSCYDRLPLFGNDAIKDLFVEHLARVTAPPTIRLIAWVVMPEHIHLIVQPLPEDAPPVPLDPSSGERCETFDHWKDPVAPRTFSGQTSNEPGPKAKMGPVARMLYDLKRPFARDVLARWRELNAPILKRITDKSGPHHSHFFQPGGGYDHNLRTDTDVNDKIDYIHANPVERGLCRFETDWKWSSIHAYKGGHYTGPPIEQPI